MLGDLSAGAVEDLLAGGVDVEQSGFTGAEVISGVAAGFGEGVGEEGFGAGATGLVGKEVGGEAGMFVLDVDGEARGGGEGIALDVIDGEGEVIEVVASAEVLVGRVGAAVDVAEGVGEVVAGGHELDLGDREIWSTDFANFPRLGGREKLIGTPSFVNATGGQAKECPLFKWRGELLLLGGQGIALEAGVLDGGGVAVEGEAAADEDPVVASEIGEGLTAFFGEETAQRRRRGE